MKKCNINSTEQRMMSKIIIFWSEKEWVGLLFSGLEQRLSRIIILWSWTKNGWDYYSLVLNKVWVGLLLSSLEQRLGGIIIL